MRVLLDFCFLKFWEVQIQLTDGKASAPFIDAHATESIIAWDCYNAG